MAHVALPELALPASEIGSYLPLLEVLDSTRGEGDFILEGDVYDPSLVSLVRADEGTALYVEDTNTVVLICGHCYQALTTGREGKSLDALS